MDHILQVGINLLQNVLVISIMRQGIREVKFRVVDVSVHLSVARISWSRWMRKLRMRELRDVYVNRVIEALEPVKKCV